MFGLTQYNIGAACADFVEGIRQWPLWKTLAFQEIKLRYRRSILGPFWLTISMGIQMATMGIVVSFLFNQSFGKFLPYICINFILWSFISGIINEGAMTFLQSAGYITQIRRPLMVYIYQMILRNFLVMGHNFVVFIGVAIGFGIIPHVSVVLLPLGLVLVVFSSSWMAVLFGLMSTRFRDVPVILQSLFGILFWLTPIIYYPHQLTGSAKLLVVLNPLAHMVDIVRQPLLGGTAPIASWIVVLIFGVLGWIIAFFSFARYRDRVVYWL